MPGKSAHIKKAERNLKLSEEDIFNPEKTKYLDWYVTTLFYTAVHYVDAILATIDIHPTQHKYRKSLVYKVSPLPLIQHEYSMLIQASRRSRYDIFYDTGDVRARKEAMNLIRCVEKIKQTVLKKIRPAK